MKRKIPVSVVMPCYNYGKYVGKAIESILQQSLTHFEFIIVDYGSTDNSRGEVLKYKDRRIRFIETRENLGNYPARNIGMRLAEGKYVCTMDADDIAVRERLEVQYAYLEGHPRIGGIGTRGERLDEQGTPLGDKIMAPIVPWSQLRVYMLLNNMVIHPSMMIRKGLLQKYDLFYDEQIRVASDYDFGYRCMSLFPFRNIEDNLIRMRVHGGQISQSRREEQIRFADQVRRRQLMDFKIPFTETEVDIYLKSMRQEKYVTDQEKNDARRILEMIVDQNKRTRLYDQKMLYAFFENAYIYAAGLAS